MTLTREQVEEALDGFDPVPALTLDEIRLAGSVGAAKAVRLLAALGEAEPGLDVERLAWALVRRIGFESQSIGEYPNAEPDEWIRHAAVAVAAEYMTGGVREAHAGGLQAPPAALAAPPRPTAEGLDVERLTRALNTVLGHHGDLNGQRAEAIAREYASATPSPRPTFQPDYEWRDVAHDTGCVAGDDCPDGCACECHAVDYRPSATPSPRPTEQEWPFDEGHSHPSGAAVWHRHDGWHLHPASSRPDPDLAAGLDADDLESISLALDRFPTWFPETATKVRALRAALRDSKPDEEAQP